MLFVIISFTFILVAAILKAFLLSFVIIFTACPFYIVPIYQIIAIVIVIHIIHLYYSHLHHHLHVHVHRARPPAWQARIHQGCKPRWWRSRRDTMVTIRGRTTRSGGQACVRLWPKGEAGGGMGGMYHPQESSWHKMILSPNWAHVHMMLSP